MSTDFRPDAHASPPLWRQLDLAARGLRAVREGQSARAFTSGWPADLRPGAAALLFNALRHAGETQALVAQLAARAPHAHVQALLMVALAILLDDAQLGYQPFTVLDQSVQALRAHKKLAAQAGFLNACLRRFTRESQALRLAVAADPQVRWNHPRWWIERLQHDHPLQWQVLLAANNARAPMVLRVNPTRTTRADYLQALADAAIAAAPVREQGVLLAHPEEARALPGYAQGWFSVQDAGAQRAAPWLLQAAAAARGVAGEAASAAPLRVLDACAAPGGKTGHLVEVAAQLGLALELVAMEKDGLRAARIGENLQRLGLAQQVAVVVADAAAPATWPPAAGAPVFDAILLDAPCSASGIVRRHPDVRWLRRSSDIAELARQQKALLAQLWPLLCEGGQLLYCTCSVFHAEGQGQIDAFVRDHADAQLAAPPLQLLPGIAPQGQDVDQEPAEAHDGFFYALLEKRPRRNG